MSRRSFQPLLDVPDARSRRHRFILALMVIALLVVVLFAAFSILPLGPVRGLSTRQARKLLVEAQRWENQSLIISAAEIYERISVAPRVDPKLRLDAATALTTLYREHPDDLHDLDRAKAALEKAYFFSPPGPEHEAIRSELEILRGHPVTAQNPAPAPTVIAASTPVVTTSLPQPSKRTEIARIGNESVSMEEILFAWSQASGGQTPTLEELKPFASMYLDMVLMADEACRRGLDRQDRLALDLRVKRVVDLNQYMMQQLINNIGKPDDDTLKSYYTSREAVFAKPATVTLAHIVVRDAKAAEAVTRSLEKGKDFKAVAAERSLDGKRNKDGYLIGPIAVNALEIPRVGSLPGLAARLAELADGATTGPLQTETGIHWLQVVGKTAPQPQPLEAVQDAVLLDYQNQQLARLRSELIAKLRQARRESVKVYSENIQARLDAAGKKSASQNPKADPKTPNPKSAKESDAATSLSLARTAKPVLPIAAGASADKETTPSSQSQKP